MARSLLGMHLVHRFRGTERRGKIVETEAYLGPQDLAAHSRHGRTARNATMFGPPGHAYVFLIYGIHHCLNVVTGRAGHGAAVLLRALEPVANLEGRANGPGLLCQALGVDRRLDGVDLRGDRLYIEDPGPHAFRIATRSRIGVDYAGAWARRRLRFYISGNLYVSRKD